MGLCNNCGIDTDHDDKSAYWIASYAIFTINYFGPILLLIPLTFLMIRLYLRYRHLPDRNKLKIFIIPGLSFVILLFNNIITIPKISSKLDNIGGVVYILFY